MLYPNKSYSQIRLVTREVPLVELQLFQPKYGKLGQKLAQAWRALRSWRKLAPTYSRRPSPIMTQYGVQGVANDWSLLLHPVQQSKPSKKQSHNTKITRVAAVLATNSPSAKIFEYRHENFTKKLQKTTWTLRLKDFEATDLALEELTFGRHRADDVLRLSLMVTASSCLARAAQKLGVRAAFWNLKFGEQYDVTHPVNLRRVFRDIADGGVLGCMMSVPSVGWNVARNRSRPFRSSAQPRGIEKSRDSMSPSDLACLDTGNRIMRTVIKLARQCQRFHVPWAIENPEKSLCWTTSQLQELSKMRNVLQNDFRLLCFWYQMAKTYSCSGRPRRLG